MPVSKPCKTRPDIMGFLRRNAFVILTVAGVALGMGLGCALRYVEMSARQIQYLSFPGELLLRLLQMVVLPLIVSSLITGMSSVDRKALGKIGLRAFGFYMLTSLLAGFTGIALGLAIKPGASSTNATNVAFESTQESVESVDAFLDLIRNMVPSNLVESCFRKFKTVYSVNPETSGQNDTLPTAGTSDGANTLGLLVFSIFFGYILGGMEDEGRPLRDFFDCLNKTIMNLVAIVIWFTPVGILFLVAGQVVKMTDVRVVGSEVLMYSLTVIVGLIIHCFFTLPLIYFTVTRRNPFSVMSGALQALATAFGTASSSATLPVTIHCMEENLHMDKRVTRFMLPTGATMNMDGGALYQAIAVLFIAQMHGIHFSLGQILVLSLIVTAVSTGTAAIPQAGIVALLIVLSTLGMPSENLSHILMVDWILERLRTSTNILGDCFGVGVVQHLSRRELQEHRPEEENLHPSTKPEEPISNGKDQSDSLL